MQTTVWVQIPKLPVEWYRQDILSALARQIGKPICIDINTLHAERAKFARLAIEVEFTKPLLGKVEIEGRWFECPSSRVPEQSVRGVQQSQPSVEVRSVASSPLQRDNSKIVRTRIAVNPFDLGSVTALLTEVMQDVKDAPSSSSHPANHVIFQAPALQLTQVQGEKKKVAVVKGRKSGKVQVMVSATDGLSSGNEAMVCQDEIQESVATSLKRKGQFPKLMLRPGVGYILVAIRIGQRTPGPGGAKSELFSSSFRDMVQQHRVHLAVILEPRISGVSAERVIRSLCFRGWAREDARGFAGGIWILWWPEVLAVSVEQRFDQFLHVRVTLHGKEPFLLTAVYDRPLESRQSVVWPYLLSLNERIRIPWILMGDFNVTAYPEETQGGVTAQLSRMARFRDWMEECGLTNLGFKGRRFTWFRGMIRCRLDRMLANDCWRQCFDDASVFHLPRIKSDHRPLLLRESTNSQGLGSPRPFRMTIRHGSLILSSLVWFVMLGIIMGGWWTLFRIFERR
ncbi:hypothetical protein Tsubulata_024088 [Turnera subulata]|uniref:Endonuclease/exonuclease/phosphatase domain-containing protein n=1 Tax=Turnera subulata TaxID=218843 RepID=A0A9Q0FK47_9ROSI|nr:hypothetical protein Tsubulata_024088 [Turnera subulata]